MSSLIVKLLAGAAGLGAAEMKYHFAVMDWGWSRSQNGVVQPRWLEQYDTDNYLFTLQGTNTGRAGLGLWTLKADADGFPTWTKNNMEGSSPGILHNQAMKNPIHSGYDVVTQGFGSNMITNAFCAIPEGGRLGTSNTSASAYQNNFTGPISGQQNNEITKLTHPSITDYVVCGNYNGNSVDGTYIAKYNSSNVLQWLRKIDNPSFTVRLYEARLLSDGSVIFLTSRGHGKLNTSGTLSWGIYQTHITNSDRVLLNVDSSETYAYVSDGDTVVSRLNISTGLPGYANHNLLGTNNANNYISGDKTQGMSIDKDGNLWITRRHSNVVGKFSPSGTFLGKYTITTNQSDPPRFNGVFCDGSAVWVYGLCGLASSISAAPFIAKLALDGSTTFSTKKVPAGDLQTGGTMDITLAWSTSGTNMTWTNISPDPDQFNVGSDTTDVLANAISAGTGTYNTSDPYIMLS